jgi:hypothetical protein
MRRRRRDGMSARKRGGVQPAHEWEVLLPLFEWPEQERYEQIRPPGALRRLGGRAGPGGGNVVQHPLPEARPLRRRRYGVPLRCPDGQAEAAAALGQAPHLGPESRVPALHNLNEIANVVRAAFGRQPDVRSIERVLEEEPMPLKMVRRYPPYHEAEDALDARRPSSPCAWRAGA